MSAFDVAQATYDAAEPEDDDMEPWKEPTVIVLERVLEAMDAHELVDDHHEVVPLSPFSATVGVWIDGHEYSLTLMRED